MRIAFIVLSLCVSAWAQEFRGSISGSVTDPSGAPVAGARITITSVERNVAQTTQTTEAGVYLVQFLLPGRYTVAVEKEGFKRTVREGISISSSDRVGMDLRMDLGT